MPTLSTLYPNSSFAAEFENRVYDRIMTDREKNGCLDKQGDFILHLQTRLAVFVEMAEEKGLLKDDQKKS